MRIGERVKFGISKGLIGAIACYAQLVMVIRFWVILFTRCKVSIALVSYDSRGDLIVRYLRGVRRKSRISLRTESCQVWHRGRRFRDWER